MLTYFEFTPIFRNIFHNAFLQSTVSKADLKSIKWKSNDYVFFICLLYDLSNNKDCIDCSSTCTETKLNFFSFLSTLTESFPAIC